MSFGKAGTMHKWTLDEEQSGEVIRHALDLAQASEFVEKLLEDNGVLEDTVSKFL